jgi:hypothetical protein
MKQLAWYNKNIDEIVIEVKGPLNQYICDCATYDAYYSFITFKTLTYSTEWILLGEL